jgi:hypothetical protein
MEVCKASMLPPSFREKIVRRKPTVKSGHVVVQKCGVLDGHGPETWISNIRPVNCRVEHHSPCYGHHRSNRSLGVAIVVMSSCTSEADVLAEILKVQFKCV